MRLQFLIIFLLLLQTSLIYSEVQTDSLLKKPKKKNIYPSIELLSRKVKELKNDEKHPYNPAHSWLPLLTLIRNDEISKQEAIEKMKKIIHDINDYLSDKNVAFYPKDSWVFPVKGYSPSAIGGVKGNGYYPGDFDFFNLSTGGHPAHDIFIYDYNQDMLDDVTNDPVSIWSMSGGIVVETRKNWTPEMMYIKGGNIVYVYDDFTNGFFYYAHLDKVFVDVGDFVEPGMVLGTMGRTGQNAYPSRSPTHLHIMYVKSYEGDLQSVDLYNDLLNAKLIP